MDYVQNCEASLEEKKKHCMTPHQSLPFDLLTVSVVDTNVVKAFESALALLRDE